MMSVNTWTIQALSQEACEHARAVLRKSGVKFADDHQRLSLHPINTDLDPELIAALQDTGCQVILNNTR